MTRWLTAASGAKPQAVLVGLVNLVFTVLAILFIDKLGRRPLLIAGLALIAALAGYLPALRASRTDPAVVLRSA